MFHNMWFMEIYDNLTSMYPTFTYNLLEVRSLDYICLHHDDVIKWNIFRVTGPLCGEFTGPRWIPRTKASDMEHWCFLWSAPE